MKSNEKWQYIRQVNLHVERDLEYDANGWKIEDRWNITKNGAKRRHKYFALLSYSIKAGCRTTDLLFIAIGHNISWGSQHRMAFLTIPIRFLLISKYVPFKNGPNPREDTTDMHHLNHRVWWYVFIIDHFRWSPTQTLDNWPKINPMSAHRLPIYSIIVIYYCGKTPLTLMQNYTHISKYLITQRPSLSLMFRVYLWYVLVACISLWPLLNGKYAFSFTDR